MVSLVRILASHIIFPQIMRADGFGGEKVKKVRGVNILNCGETEDTQIKSESFFTQRQQIKGDEHRGIVLHRNEKQSVDKYYEAQKQK